MRTSLFRFATCVYIMSTSFGACESFQYSVFPLVMGRQNVGRMATYSAFTTKSSPSEFLQTSVHAERQRRRFSRGAKTLSLMQSDPMMDNGFSVPLLLVTALVLGIAAQSFINQMLEGDDGLGAFLKDGSGYNRSGFRSSRPDPDSNEKNDPLPWLKLPELDFVDVAGQERSSPREGVIFERLEAMRRELNAALDAGRVREAQSLQDEMERFMVDQGIEFKSDEL